LIALVIVGPKYAQRQSQIEQNGQKRQWAAQLAVGGEVNDAPAANNVLAVALWPLFVVLGLLLAVAWIKLIRDHMNRRKQVSVTASPVEAARPPTGQPVSESNAAGIVAVSGDQP